MKTHKPIPPVRGLPPSDDDDDCIENEPTTEQRDAAVRQHGLPGPAHPIDRLHPANNSEGPECAAKSGCCSKTDECTHEGRSNCCGAPLIIEGDHTLYYVCAECKKPCDAQASEVLEDVPTTTSDKEAAALKRIENRWSSPWNAPVPPELIGLSLQPHVDRIIKGITLENKRNRQLGISEGLNAAFIMLRDRARDAFMAGQDEKANDFRTMAKSLQVVMDLNSKETEGVEKQLEEHAKGK